MRPDIVVGIPSWREADSIAQVTLQVDRGLQHMYGAERCLIVNVDNESDDGTKEAFLSTSTSCSKVYLSTGSDPRGKGKNLLRMMQFCLEHDTQFMATMDADVVTVTSDWPVQLLEPLISRGADYTSPIYQRNRFEGSTTNHFAFPLMYGVFGAQVRQPIGGEFGFSRRFAEYTLQQKTIPEVEQYGIDIFMTAHAIAGGFTVQEVFLGRKIHKPSFPKIGPMFAQVAASALQVVHAYRERKIIPQVQRSASSHGIDVEQKPTDPEAVKKLLERAKDDFRASHPLPSFLPDELTQKLEAAIAASEPKISSDLWSWFLACCVKEAMQEDFPTEKRLQLVALLTPVFLERAATLWRYAVTMEPSEVEWEIRNQAELFRRELHQLRSL